jgi:hypothetical protein
VLKIPSIQTQNGESGTNTRTGSYESFALRVFNKNSLGEGSVAKYI